MHTTALYRPAAARGTTHISWLHSRHSFSFSEYYDPEWMGFAHLRVLNDDIIAPDRGFGTHPHRDMEIISYVVSGGLEHQDTLGSGAVLRPGGVQLMRAGTGIAHSEWNPSPQEPGRFLQIWILPREKGLAPGWWQKDDALTNDPRWHLLVSPDGAEGSLKIAQNCALRAVRLGASETATLPVSGSQKIWFQSVRGSGSIAGQDLQEGDGLGLDTKEAQTVTAGPNGWEVLAIQNW